jgi:hypothetical protein
VAAPRKRFKSVQVEPGAAECAGVPFVSTVDALVGLRKILDNDELAERIPTELSGAGFTRVFFSRTRQGLPHEHDDSSIAPTPAARLTVPVFAWHKPVGQLHAFLDPAAGDGDLLLLRLLAEAVGTIFERNVLTERLRTADTSAREHVREMNRLSDSSLTWRFDDAN